MKGPRFCLTLLPGVAATAAAVACLWFAVVMAALAPQSAWAGPARGSIARSAELVLKPDEAYRDVAGLMSHLKERGRSLSLEEAIRADRAGRFEPMPSGAIDFGFTDARIWLKLRVRNETDAPRPSVLALNVNYMDEIDAWLVSNGTAQSILHQTEKSAFATRPMRTPRLAAPFTLGPGQSAEIYIAFWSTGGASMPLAIETPASFAQRLAEESIPRTASYTLLGMFVALSLLLWATMRSPLFLLYAFYTGCALLFVMHGDGETFHRLWPDWPQWSVFASVPLGYGLVIGAGFFARAFLQTEKIAPRLDKIILCIIAAAAFGIAAGLAGFPREARMGGFFLVLTGSLVFLLGGLRAIRACAPGAHCFVIGWSAISLSAAGAVLAVNTSLAPSIVTIEFVRYAVLVDAIMMTCALMIYVVRIRTQRDESIGRELAAMRANLDLIGRIDALEQRHTLAASAAVAHDETLASALHDMRQPILSLRLAVQRLANEPGAAPDAAQLETSLSYLEDLADTLLDRAPPGAQFHDAAEDASPKARGPDSGARAPGVETFDAQLVLDALDQMFARKARAKGLRFACLPSKYRLIGEPLVIIRMLSNFVSNAVSNAETGGIVVGCRRRAGRIWLCVFDTGPGLPPEQTARIFAPAARAAMHTDGARGLGLSIVGRLAREHGLLIEARSVPGRGSALGVGVLAASDHLALAGE
jgi:signal transduction histidine kinase